MRGVAIKGTFSVMGIAAIISSALMVHRNTAAQTQAAPSATVHRCSNIQVVIRPSQSLGGALGHTGTWYRIRDLSSSPCSLGGFPGVELLDREFRSLPTHLQHGGYITSAAPPARTVVLDRGHDAYFALEYTDVQVESQPCPSAPFVMITPPNDALPIVTYSGIGAACSGQVGVSPVESTAALP